MTRKQRRPYSQPGKGQIEIGDLRTQATWEETGEQEAAPAGSRTRRHAAEGRKVNVKWRITFGQVSGHKREALRDILRQRAADERSLFTVVLNGVKYDSLYLDELTVVSNDPIPHGFVFSNGDA
ncbi:MAG TPA: hypothetical protein VND64_06670 [Pirellulales bacterium]|nr:hypothetical protein [Pirellulales bacterium]